MKILFCSSSEISLRLLSSLHQDKDIEIVGLICQPDKLFGRKKEIKMPATKTWALQNNIPVYQPEKLSKAKDLLEDFKSQNIDILLTFAYGQILRQSWLDLALPINIHASILPKYRGASPIQAALLNGEIETGISVMEMVKTMDAGDVYKTHKVEIQEKWDAEILFDEISKLAAKEAPDTLKKIHSGEINKTAQEEEKATYCSKINKEDAYVNFEKTAEEILNMKRAYSPWPGIWTQFEGKRMKILELEKSELSLSPKQVAISNKELHVGTKLGSLQITKLQLEGKKPSEVTAFLNGLKSHLKQLPSHDE